MANLRVLKKEIDYRLEEFVFDCEMAAFMQPNKEEQIVELMAKSVDLRNLLFHKAPFVCRRCAVCSNCSFFFLF